MKKSKERSCGRTPHEVPMGNIVDYDITTYEQWNEKILSLIIECAAMERSGAGSREIKKVIHPLLQKWISERKEDVAFQKQFRSENRDNPYIINFLESLTVEKFIAYLQDTKDDTALCNEYSSRAAYFDAADRELFRTAGRFCGYCGYNEETPFSELEKWLTMPLREKKGTLIVSFDDFLSSPKTRLDAFLMRVKVNTVFWEENQALKEKPRELFNRSYEEAKDNGEELEQAWLKRIIHER